MGILSASDKGQSKSPSPGGLGRGLYARSAAQVKGGHSASMLVAKYHYQRRCYKSVSAGSNTSYVSKYIVK